MSSRELKALHIEGVPHDFLSEVQSVAETVVGDNPGLYADGAYICSLVKAVYDMKQELAAIKETLDE